MSGMSSFLCDNIFLILGNPSSARSLGVQNGGMLPALFVRFLELKWSHWGALPQLTLLCQLLCSFSVRSQEMSSLSGQKKTAMDVGWRSVVCRAWKKFLNMKPKSGKKSYALWCNQIVLLDRMYVFIVTTLTFLSVFLPSKYFSLGPLNQAFCEVHS
jgi:hypothetical protein